MHVESFYDTRTSTLTHVVVDEETKKCATIDSVLDYDQDAGRFYTESADKVVQYIQDNNLENEWILETHIHADHITGAFYLKGKIGGKTAIGTRIKEVLELWVPIFELVDEVPLSGEQFDKLFEDGEKFNIGTLNAEVFQTPGHTPACSTYHIEDSVFVGDTVFNPNLGTARCDFPGGSADDLYQSIQRIYALPEDTFIYLCHDYPKGDDQPLVRTTIGEQKKNNIMLNGNTAREEYVEKRTARDNTLAVPKLLFPSIQTNIRLGDFGDKSEVTGFRYIKIPVGMFDHAN